ncbi:Asp23/Gls24 family envelope stress response protein [Pseudonocardia asaccharolytica]|uniref:Asp23/Gls24 family envelope stress response protein n=1 Tax=Pseudonocardia asaccharolytica DSM 44247 = NBRC 16224 TaxID=1123024 RepID=A0A511CW36_9PSEU|nr:Asp23/Gls24 family envelope stress response protein [Pseudonocardia asaccharolytica]GEL16796.1 hypothetical protein PA7_06330 [Pseudonocardia asaccharolytica DSM 44247 = NBRC 16224]
MTEVRYHVGERLLARLAARHARQVPGVAGLHPAGATARVEGGSAEVALAIVTRLGYNCRDVAVAVQRAVGGALTRYTGLDVRVRVTITDVLLD